MKFMKLGSRPDTFFTVSAQSPQHECIRTLPSEVTTDLRIKLHDCIYHLHKFPLLSKCGRLRQLCIESNDAAIHFSEFPAGLEGFEICMKYCYGITITLSATNIAHAICSAEYLRMTEDIERDNFVPKLQSFFKSCILRRWRDTLVVLRSTMNCLEASEKLRIIIRCVDAIMSMIVAHPSKTSWLQQGHKRGCKTWWAEDIAEIEICLYCRIIVAVKSSERVSDTVLGEALAIYAYRWLPNFVGDEHRKLSISKNNALLLEQIVRLLPMEKQSMSCTFLLNLLKYANLLCASQSTKMGLSWRIGSRLEEARVSDLLIPSSPDIDGTMYDVDMVIDILKVFLLQGHTPKGSPPRHDVGGLRRRHRSAEDFNYQEMDNRRRSTSASHGSILRVAKIVDGYLQEVARDQNLEVHKLVELANMVPEFARTNHDDIYTAIDNYLRTHPNLDKKGRKELCQILDCRKLSVQASVHAAQNDLLPLRILVQVLFFEQSKSSTIEAPISNLPSNEVPLLTKGSLDQSNVSKGISLDNDRKTTGEKTPASNIETLRMKLTEADDDLDGCSTQYDGLGRSTSLSFRAFCAIHDKRKRIISKLCGMNRCLSERG